MSDQIKPTTTTPRTTIQANAQSRVPTRNAIRSGAVSTQAKPAGRPTTPSENGTPRVDQTHDKAQDGQEAADQDPDRPAADSSRRHVRDANANDAASSPSAHSSNLARNSPPKARTSNGAAKTPKDASMNLKRPGAPTANNASRDRSAKGAQGGQSKQRQGARKG